MAGIARKDVEILVHTTAPSRGQDDARYRRMAEAYLNFQPATHQRIEEELPEAGTENLVTEGRSELQDELQQATQETQDMPQSGASYHPDEYSSEEEDIYEYLVENPVGLSQELHSPSMSFKSVANNLSSPIFRARITQHDSFLQLQPSQVYEIADSWVAPPSEVPDSQPESRNAMTIFSSPTRMLELYLQIQESQGTRSTPDKSSGQLDVTSSLGLPSGLRGALSSSPDRGPIQSSPSPVKGPGRHSQRITEPRHLKPPFTQDPALNMKRKWVSSSAEESRSSSAPPKPSSPYIQVPMSSQPRTSATRATYDLILTTVANNLGHESYEIVRSAADAILDRLKGDDMKDFDKKKKEIDDLLGATLTPKRFNELVNLGKKITDYNAHDEDEVMGDGGAGVEDGAEIDDRPLPPRPEKRACLFFASSQTIPSSSKLTATPNASSFQGPGAWWELLEIRPKPPATSTGELTAEMFITSHLAALARRMPSRLYSPASTKRELRGMERGYWLVECKDWNVDLQQKFWDTLGSYIGKDMAGWGVWCIRDEDFTSVRVYCWGVVVKHIYLLLYMASNNRIKKARARWIGGDGETIIQML